MKDELIELLRPFADYHGDLPDYDHSLRPVYESGIQYAVELLAKVLKVDDWKICDGTEEFDGDLGGTLLNIVVETWPKDSAGDWIDLRDPDTRAAHAVMAAKIEELREALDCARQWLMGFQSNGGAHTEDILAHITAALAPHPEGTEMEKKP